MFFFTRLIPIALIWLVATILAIATWKRHPGVSALTFLGTSLLLASSVFSNLFGFIAPTTRVAGRLALRYGLLNQVGTGIQLVMTLIAWICIFYAIFGWRSQRVSTAASAFPIARSVDASQPLE